jgi:hypothetical protein
MTAVSQGAAVTNMTRAVQIPVIRRSVQPATGVNKIASFSRGFYPRLFVFKPWAITPIGYLKCPVRLFWLKPFYYLFIPRPKGQGY